MVRLSRSSVSWQSLHLFSCRRCNYLLPPFNDHQALLRNTMSGQFQYGAIKGDTGITYKGYPLEFQFQYGAIKGWFACPEKLVYPEFQFQYGAIKGVQC